MRHAACCTFVLAVANTAAVAATMSPHKPDTVSAALAPFQSRPCNSSDACIAAVLAAARAGRPMDQLTIIASMASAAAPEWRSDLPAVQRPNPAPDTIAVGNVDAMLPILLRGAQRDLSIFPEYTRMSALFLIKSNQFDEAEQVLRKALYSFPTQAAFWADLGLVFGQQGKVDDAVAALVVAENWSANPVALREGYAQAAKSGPVKAMQPVYAAALQAIANNTAALERVDAGLPAVSLTSDTGNAEKGNAATVQFEGCTPPQYPLSSARYGETGRVTLAYYVGADGQLLRAKKLESTGHIELDNAALVAIAACRWKPASNEGKAVPAWGKVQYVWSLEN